MRLKVVIRIVVLAVVAAAFGWLAMHLDWHDLGQRFAEASPAYLAAMVAAWLGAFVARVVRLRFVINSFHPARQANFRATFAAMVLGMAVNSFAPMRAGDAVLAVFLRQRMGVELHRGVAVIIVDWFCDFLCVGVIFCGALAFAPAIAAWTGHAVTILSTFAIAAAAGIWILLAFHKGLLRLLDRGLARLLPRRRERIMTSISQIMVSFIAVCNWRTVIPLLLLSGLIWSMAACSYWLGVRAVFPPAPVAAGAFTSAAVTLSFVLPLGPAGLGAFEAASILALAVFNIPLEAAIAFAVIAHLTQLAITLLLAAVVILTQQVDFRALGPSTGKS